MAGGIIFMISDGISMPSMLTISNPKYSLKASIICSLER